MATPAAQPIQLDIAWRILPHCRLGRPKAISQGFAATKIIDPDDLGPSVSSACGLKPGHQAGRAAEGGWHAAGVLFLSRLLGKEVVGRDLRQVGRLADLTVALGDEVGPLQVRRLLVRGREGSTWLIPWNSIDAVRPAQLVLATGDPSRFEIASVDDVLDDDEILLARDVLDTQVVDVVGQRLARVADVVLARNAPNILTLVGLEVGFAGVLRRLGLPGFAARIGENTIAWTDLHLTSQRGHVVQLGTPRAVVHHLDARALATLVSHLDTTSAAEVLANRGPEIAAEVLGAAHPLVGERVLRALPEERAGMIVAAMPEKQAMRWRNRLRNRPALRGRHLLRFQVWPRRGHQVKR